MSDSNDSSQIPQSTTFGTIGFLANNPLVADDPSKDKHFVSDYFFEILFFLQIQARKIMIPIMKILKDKGMIYNQNRLHLMIKIFVIENQLPLVV
jgi:hypothetical protein